MKHNIKTLALLFSIPFCTAMELHSDSAEQGGSGEKKYVNAIVRYGKCDIPDLDLKGLSFTITREDTRHDDEKLRSLQSFYADADAGGKTVPVRWEETKPYTLIDAQTPVADHSLRGYAEELAADRMVGTGQTGTGIPAVSPLQQALIINHETLAGTPLADILHTHIRPPCLVIIAENTPEECLRSDLTGSRLNVLNRKVYARCDTSMFALETVKTTEAVCVREFERFTQFRFKLRHEVETAEREYRLAFRQEPSYAFERPGTSDLIPVWHVSGRMLQENRSFNKDSGTCGMIRKSDQHRNESLLDIAKNSLKISFG